MRKIKSLLVCTLAMAAISAGAQPPQQQQRGQMTPEQRAKQTTERLAKELGLNETQQKQVYEIQLKTSAGFARPTEGDKRTREEMQAEFEKAREAQKTEMKKILTSEQFSKWEKMQAERGSMRSGGAGGGMRGNSGGQRPAPR